MSRESVPALDPRRYGFSVPLDSLRTEFISPVLPETENVEEDTFNVAGLMEFPGDSMSNLKTMQEIAERLAQVYCGGTGYEVRKR